jgi:hypothetical protein
MELGAQARHTVCPPGDWQPERCQDEKPGENPSQKTCKACTHNYMTALKG